MRRWFRPVSLLTLISMTGAAIWVVAALWLPSRVDTHQVGDSQYVSDALSLVTRTHLDAASSDTLKMGLVSYVLDVPVTVIAARARDIAILELYREMIIAPLLQEMDPLAAVAPITGPLANRKIQLDKACYTSLMDISTTIKALYAHTLPGNAYAQCIADGDLKISSVSDDKLRAVLLLLDAAQSMESFSSRWNFAQIADSTLAEIEMALEAASAPLNGYLAAGLLRGNLDLFRFAAETDPDYFYRSTPDAEMRVCALDSALAHWKHSMLPVLNEHGCVVQANVSANEFLHDGRYAALAAVLPDRFLSLNDDCLPYTAVVLAWINNELEAFNWRFLPLPAARADMFDAINPCNGMGANTTHVDYANMLVQSATRMLNRVHSSNAGPEIEARVRVTLVETQCTLERLASLGLISAKKTNPVRTGDDRVLELMDAVARLPVHVRSAHMHYLCDSRFLRPMWGGLPRDLRWCALERAGRAVNREQ